LLPSTVFLAARSQHTIAMGIRPIDSPPRHPDGSLGHRVLAARPLG
jgi:hypothetical protein